MSLNIANFCASINNQSVVNGVSLGVNPGAVHAIMGPNGSGKSSLANALASHPKYTTTGGQITLNGKNITKFSPEKKARAGLLLSMQNSPTIVGVSVANFLRVALGAMTGVLQNPQTFYKSLLNNFKTLNIDPTSAKRSVNVGFSGGEKKRLEILQLLMLKPKYAILDEIDSGLDVDSLKIVAKAINQLANNKTGVIIITHYNRILKHVKPDFVHIFYDGKIVKSGRASVAREIEANGYNKFL